MRSRAFASIFAALSALTSTSGGCARFGAVYPARPTPTDGVPVSDPAPSRIVVHLTVTGDALRSALESALPRTGDGTFPLLGSDRHYAWERGPLDVSFGGGRVSVRTSVRAHVELPLHAFDVLLDLRIDGEPVVASTYEVKLQGVDVQVTSHDARLALADRLGGVYETLAAALTDKLRAFRYDLAPLIGEAYARIARPIPLPLGLPAAEPTDDKARAAADDPAKGACAELHVLGVEAGPTVLADGLEKDLAVVIAPSVSLPCGVVGEGSYALPPLSNVSSVPSGPFVVTVPVAARYDELARAMDGTFTEGKLFFSTEYPDLYLEKPEIYEGQGVLVVKLHLHGPVHKFGVDADLDGDLFLSGHPSIVDNELSIPDLEPTIETKNFLLSLKALTDTNGIRDQARAALRLDLGARFRTVRGALASDLTFGVATACFQGAIDRIEISGVYPHAAYLRVYVTVTARARATMPCVSGAAIAPSGM